MSKVRYVLPLALLISGVANAAADNPWYAGFRVGATHYNDISVDGVDSNSAFDRDDMGGGLFAGYNVTPWFAVETGYTWLGRAEFDNNYKMRVDQQAIDLVGKFTWHATDYMGLYAKLGGAYYFSEAKGFGAEKYKDDGVVGTAGAGLEFFLDDHLSARLEYQYYHDVELKDKNVNANWDTHFYGLSLVYSWGAPEPVAEPVYVDQVSVATLEELKLAVPFAFDSSSISAGDAAKLVPFEQRLQEQDAAQIYVVGYTDSKGSEAYNQKLSERRADAVADALRAHLNVDGSRIIAEGRGEADPVASNQTEEGRAQNRRVEIVSPSIDIETVTQVLAE